MENTGYLNRSEAQDSTTLLSTSKQALVEQHESSFASSTTAKRKQTWTKWENMTNVSGWSDLFRPVTPDWRTCFHRYKLLWFRTLIWQFLLNPLISKHGFVKLDVIRAVSAVQKSFACFLSLPGGFVFLFGCVSDVGCVCPSQWIQTAELECEGWNHMSKVPQEKLSEHNIWLDEVKKSAS